MRPATSSDAGTPLAIRSRSRAAAADKKFGQALTLWDSQPAPLTHPGDLRWRAVATTDQKLPEDPVVAAELGRVFPVELELTRAVRLRDERRGDGLAQQLVVAFEAAREHPLYDSESTRVAFKLAKSVGEGRASSRAATDGSARGAIFVASLGASSSYAATGFGEQRKIERVVSEGARTA